MTQRYTNILVTDSRGRGLDDFVGQHLRPITHDYVIEVLPGRSPAQLIPIIDNIFGRYDRNTSYCVVLAGICGLTVRSTINNRQHLRYPLNTRTERVDNVLTAFRELKRKFGDHINICTIIPASLADYHRHFHPDLPLPTHIISEQTALEEDIIFINRCISELNLSVTNINLASRIQTNSKKKRQRSGSKTVYRRVTKFNYSQLPDGLHFSESLRNICFTLILNTAIKDIQNLFTPEQQKSDTPNFSDTDTEQSDSDRDFRRHRRHAINV